MMESSSIERDRDGSSDATANNNNNTDMDMDRSFNKFNFANLFGYVANTFITFAIGTGGLFGRPTNGEISAKYQTIVTPVGLAFSIWGLIFLLQGAWVLWQLLPSQRNSVGVHKVGYLYLLVSLAQCAWTFAFSYEVMWLSLVSMYAICAFLVLAVVRLQTWNNKTLKEYFLWQFPMSLHCGWIIAASAVNTNVLPVYYEASASVQIGVASACLAALILVAAAWLAPYPVDLAVPLVLVWALLGVYWALDDPVDSILTTFSESQIEGIKYASLGGLSFIAVGIVVKSAFVLAVQRPARLLLENEQQQSSEIEKPAESSGSGTDEENPAE